MIIGGIESLPLNNKLQSFASFYPYYFLWRTSFISHAEVEI